MRRPGTPGFTFYVLALLLTLSEIALAGSSGEDRHLKAERRT
jgi:hypothetical protein